MIEHPPHINITTNDIPIMVKLQLNGDFTIIINEYQYWDKVKYKAKTISPIKLWSVVKQYRKLRYTSLSFGKYAFNFMVTESMQRSLHEADMHIGGNLGSNIGIAETDKRKFMVNSIMEEAISSSQIEGAITTRKQAKDMIRQEKRPRNKSEQMIMNNFITMKHIVQHKNEDISSEGILNIHQLISKGTLDDNDDKGRFRINNDIHVVNHSNSEVVHTPPNVQELEELINDLCNFFNYDSKTFIHPIIKGCIIHFMIGWIHPFADGNGRTARALFYWYMLRRGYWLTEYLSISRIIQENKVQYEKAYLYVETDENDLGYFIHYHIKTMEKAYAALKLYISTKQREVSQAARFMKIPGINDRMAQILKIIYDDGDRVLSIKEIENRFSISRFTASTDLKTLNEFGFLDIVQVNKKKRNYIKSNQFDKIISRY